MILDIQLDWASSHVVGACESQILMFSTYGVGVKTDKLEEAKVKFLVLFEWSVTYVLLVVGIRDSAHMVWPLDRVRNCVIQSVLAHHEDCHFQGFKVGVEMHKF